MDDWWTVYEEGNFEELNHLSNNLKDGPSRKLINLFLEYEHGDRINFSDYSEQKENPYFQLLNLLYAWEREIEDQFQTLLKRFETTVKSQGIPEMKPYLQFFECYILFRKGHSNRALQHLREWEKKREKSTLLLELLFTILLARVYSQLLRGKEALSIISSFKQNFDNLPFIWKAKIDFQEAQVALSAKNYLLAGQLAEQVFSEGKANGFPRITFLTGLFLSELSLIMGKINQCGMLLTTCLSYSTKYATKEELVKVYHLLSLNNIIMGRYDVATIYERLGWNLVNSINSKELKLVSLYIRGLNMIMTNFGVIEVLNNLEKPVTQDLESLKLFFLLSLKMFGKIYTIEELQELSKLIHTTYLPQIFLVINLPILINELMNKFQTSPDITMVYLTNTLSMINDLEETLMTEPSIFLKVSVHLLKFRLYYMLRDSGVGDLHLALAQNFIQTYNLKFFQDLLRIYLKPLTDAEASKRIDIFDFFESDLKSMFDLDHINEGPITFCLTTNGGIELYQKYFQNQGSVFLGGWLTGFLFLLQSMNEVELTEIEVSDIVFLNKRKSGFHFWLIQKRGKKAIKYQEFSDFVDTVDLNNLNPDDTKVFDIDSFSTLGDSLNKFIGQL